MAAPSKVYNGKYATVEWDGATIVNLTDWEVTITRDSTDATPMTVDCTNPDLRWNTPVVGGIGWTAVANGYITGSDLDVTAADSDVAGIAGTAADVGLTVKFYFECKSVADGYLEGTAYMSTSGWGATSTSIETINYGFTGTGRLEYKTA